MIFNLRMAEGELRAGHQDGFAEFLIQFVRGVVEGAPAFFVRAAPERRMRVQSLQVEHGDADLAHGAMRVGHDFTEHLLQHFIDDGIEELRMFEPVAGADFGEIVEPHGQAELARLHQLPAQLAGEAGGLAQHEGERGFVIVFVVRERGAAGNGGAVFDFQHERFVPLAVGEQPQLLAPDAELLFQQHRGQVSDIAEGEGHERGERALAVLADAGHFRHRPVFEKFFFRTGGHFEKAGALGGVGREFRQLRGIGQTRRYRQSRLFQDALPDALDEIRWLGVAPNMFVKAGDR